MLNFRGVTVFYRGENYPSYPFIRLLLHLSHHASVDYHHDYQHYDFHKYHYYYDEHINSWETYWDVLPVLSKWMK